MKSQEHAADLDNDAIHHHEDDESDISHKKEVKKLLEKRLEQKRLRDELEDFDGELEDDFDWDEFE